MLPGSSIYARLRRGWDAYSVRLLALIASAIAGPLLLLFVTPGWLALPLAIGAALAGLFAISRALKPLDQIAARLERYAAPSDDATAQAAPSIARMLDNTDAIATRLVALSLRTRRHPITNLPTRSEFFAEITEDFDQRDVPILMGVVRFANYKQIAAFDVPAADRALAAFARGLRDAVSANRPIAHVDRDCFAVWFRGAPQPKQAAAELQAISYALGQELKDGDLVIAPDIQVGSAIHPLDCDDPGALLTRAMVSLTRAQRTAGGTVAFIPERCAIDARRRFELEQDLRGAIRGRQLHLHYQPLVDLKEARVVGAEALLRWSHPTLGNISPAEFVPILEQSGLVHEIGLWTLNAACRQVRAWRDAGWDNLRVAVNLSAEQLRDPSLQKVILSTLRRYDLEPQCLELELTETAAMEDADRTLALFTELKELGFGLAIDDFGSGYSSLSYLKKLPFSKLKIDREFVSHADTRSNSRAICKALVELGAGLSIDVLAEGVERREEVEELRRLGCTSFQGYYFSRPLTPAVFTQSTRDPEWLALLASPVLRERADLQRRIAL